MRIGYMYGFHAYPPRGGNHTHAYEIVRNMLDHGADVCAVDDPTMPGVKNLSSNDKQWLDDLEHFTDVLCIRVDARHLRKWDAFKKVVCSDYRKPVFFEINSPSYESLAYSWLGGKNVWSADSESMLRRFRRWVHAKRQGPKIALEERFRKKVAQKLHGAVCVSSAIENYAHKLGISNTRVLPNGGPLFSKDEVKSIRASSKKNNRLFNIFYSGSAIYPWQGLDILARVIELSQEEEPSFHFTLAVNQNIDGLTKTNNVTILEALTRKEVFRQISASDVCVSLHPDYWWSHIGSYYSPIKLFEYMALAGTVLTSNHGQMKDIIKDGINGYLTENDPYAVLDKLKNIRACQKKGKDVGWQAWKEVQERYNWAYVAKETVKFFSKR